MKKDMYGSEIRYQPHIEHYVYWGVTLTRKLSKFQVLVDFVLRSSIIVLEKMQKNYQTFGF